MFGGHAQANNNCRETTVAVRTAAGGDYELDVRAYNDGVALRSRLAAKPGRKINGESTEWKMSGNPLAWFQTDFGSYEGIFQSSPLDDFSAGQKIPLPITFNLPGGGYALVTEANLLNYSDLGVQVAADHSLRAYFHASQKGWTTDDAVVQPWRVTLLARDLNALVNSDLIRNLCPPTIAGTGQGRDGFSPAVPRGNGGRAAGRFIPSSINGWTGRNNSASSITSLTKAGEIGGTTARTTGPVCSEVCDYAQNARSEGLGVGQQQRSLHGRDAHQLSGPRGRRRAWSG